MAKSKSFFSTKLSTYILFSAGLLLGVGVISFLVVGSNGFSANLGATVFNGTGSSAPAKESLAQCSAGSVQDTSKAEGLGSATYTSKTASLASAKAYALSFAQKVCTTPTNKQVSKNPPVNGICPTAASLPPCPPTDDSGKKLACTAGPLTCTHDKNVTYSEPEVSMQSQVVGRQTVTTYTTTITATLNCNIVRQCSAKLNSTNSSSNTLQ